LARKRDEDTLESNATDLNVIEQVKILKESPMVKKRVGDGRLRIVGARYNLQSGKVELLNKGD
jgi:carbonic anhydrase